ncbi:hypothetical protein SAMN05421833_102458 [Microbispora rosea]|uniref:Uncharacterized protein n=1 Tax=Microbispora rosea TaxID=58117 RepID=A0A1N6TRV8_9ACTN|nr:hypothetical protein [Microbispora rosea]GIH44966.1 hypothetical protein Mro03_01450 [Microbispora rosea subsp. rosea]SIQ56081.1 hypothetical protein SAMN05421833_102458 [Microbispora rosea]
MDREDRQLPVAYSPGVMDDLRALPLDLRRVAILMIGDLVTGRERGVETAGDRFGLDLRGCRKAYFGTSEERRQLGRAPWRIVYQELLHGDNRQPVIHIIAIRPKRGMLAYEVAAQRLGRHTDPQLAQANDHVQAAGLQSTTGPSQGPAPATSSGLASARVRRRFTWTTPWALDPLGGSVDPRAGVSSQQCRC